MIVQANSAYMPLEDESVHCAVTSIPYWGLRDYGLKPQIWGGRADCRHEWGEALPAHHPGQVPDNKAVHTTNATGQNSPAGQFCIRCGAWRGSLGLEPTLDLFITNIVSIFREVWRVLRNDGTLWLNVGDTFATASNGRSAAATKATGNDNRTFRDKPFSTVGNGLKAKDLCMVPARVALALQADGWYIRSEITWCKTSPMPESVNDRPTNATEKVYLLTKSPRYFYDQEAVRVSGKEWTGQAGTFKRENGKATELEVPGQSKVSHRYERDDRIRPGRNLWNYWLINSEPYPAAHYATFPTKLVEPCILAGTSARGCCPKCGAGWVRVVEKEFLPMTDRRPEKLARASGQKGVDGSRGDAETPRGYSNVTTTGWRPGCGCGCSETVPAVVLDPFCGSGTTGYVAHQLGRRFVGLDLSPIYLAENALPRAEGKTSQKAIDQLPLFKKEAAQ